MNIRKSLRAWGTYRMTVRELQSLDNRMLNDLGIRRDDIQSIAKRSIAETF